MSTRTIVDVGKFLQKHGLNIGEHPAFGGVGSGHSPTGYHPVGMAIDVRDWRPDMAPAYPGGQKKHWKQRTGELSWRAKQLGLFNEALGPGDKGHDTHVHLALQGNKAISDQQLEWLATGRYKTPEGKLTDVMPAPPALALPAPEQTQKTNEERNNTLMASLFGLDSKQTLKEQLIKQALIQAKQSSPLEFLQDYSTAITPEQAMELFA